MTPGPTPGPATDPAPDPAPDPDGAFVDRRHVPAAGDGALSGTVFAVKDNIAVAGMTWSAGHPLYADRRALATAPAISRLLDAGAACTGMTATDAGGFGATTPQTANPVRPGFIVGGSSGGAAAAVARGHCDFALGTDTGGSVRIPAACTGLWAFKPTWGRVPAGGVWPLARSLDTVGPIAAAHGMLRRAACVLLAEGMDDETADTPPEIPLRLAVEEDAEGLWDPAVAAALDDAAARLAGTGHAVERLVVPGRRDAARAHGILVLSEAAPVYGHLDDAGIAQLGDAARRALRHAATITPETVAEARETASMLRASTDRALAGLDGLVSPTLPVEVPAAGARRIPFAGDEVPAVVALTALTCHANLAGIPAVAFPFGGTGLQVAGARGGDVRLLAVAGRIADALEARP